MNITDTSLLMSWFLLSLGLLGAGGGCRGAGPAAAAATAAAAAAPMLPGGAPAAAADLASTPGTRRLSVTWMLAARK